ncbi:MAG TPA: hypothetical protein H9814_11005 [Candidatus Bacteroides merdigallinarum]|uniref:Outer membrane lipoprotein carrier protein LolA n=1 Tax=Candidatus Bacteroides merdigallinarum TaxID=2838473 RepID=A0A9D2J204_9BACE|nr:hypothetical protein [Candidatus Bacteroides merdigallinarum]
MRKLIGFIGLWWALCLAMPVSAQNNARGILQRAAETFRRSGGVSASFAIHSSEGNSTGIIRLKGEKFVLEAGGMTTWFDGRTQWTYLPSSDEVNISEPTDEELQTLNPYAWLYLYDNGYDLQILPAETSDIYKVKMSARSAEAQVEQLVLWLDKSSLHPMKFSITLAGNVEPTLIIVRDYRTRQAYTDAMFVFDPAEYPTAEVIDLR